MPRKTAAEPGKPAESKAAGSEQSGSEPAAAKAAPGSKPAESKAAGSEQSGSEPAAAKAPGSKPAGSKAAKAAGAKAAGSKQAGSEQAGSEPAAANVPESKAAGSKAAGSKQAGSKQAAAKAAGSKAAGAKPAGSKQAAAKAAGSKPAGSKAAGAKAAGSKPAAGKAGAAGKGRPVPPPPGPGLVVGTVPALARVAGGVAVLAAVLLMIAPAFPLARSRGVDLGGPGNLWAFVPPLPLAATVAAGGVLALRARLPRLGLAVLFPAGTVAAGLLLQDVALLRTGSHSTIDLPLGIGTSARYEVGPGLVTAVVGYGVLVAAAVLATAAWPRTIMEDTGDLDPRRPRLAAWGLGVGVLTALVLGMAPYASSIGPGAPTLPERHGLDLLGGVVVALGAAIWCVVAATLRPRLAVVGAYAGLAATLLSIGLAIALLVARSPALGVSAGGVGVLLAALATAVLGLVAARVGRPAGKA